MDVEMGRFAALELSVMIVRSGTGVRSVWANHWTKSVVSMELRMILPVLLCTVVAWRRLISFKELV